MSDDDGLAESLARGLDDIAHGRLTRRDDLIDDPYVTYVSAEEFDRLQARLDEPPRDLPRLRALFAKSRDIERLDEP
jgi:PHD/YefM family antitoxin component YafN of YafNO toxin-antitoxin module